VKSNVRMLVAVTVLAAACAQTYAHAQTRAANQTPPPRAQESQGSVLLVLEFDLPVEFTTEPAGRVGAVTGFRVGFFRTDMSTPIRTVDIPRDSVIVRGNSARLTVPNESVPDCGGECAIRLQTLSVSASSAWSEAVSLAAPSVVRRTPETSPSPERRAAARRDQPPNRSAASSAPRARATPIDMDRYPALAEALGKILPKDTSIEAEAGRFRRVQELALATVISREFDIPFTTLSKAIVGPPRLAPRDVLVKLRPGVDVRTAIRKARAEARRMIGPPVQGGAQK
jgi:hypothetical protein